MRITYAKYEHTTIGFPHVILKWFGTHDKPDTHPYITVKGVMQPWSWTEHFRPGHNGDLEKEIARFDKYVRERYSNDASVQG